MGVINNIKNYFEERSLNKLEKKVSKIWERNNISFNPYNISNVINPLSDNNFSLRTMENFTWFSGSVEMLLSFYYYNKRKTGQFSKDDLMYFWGNVPFENRRVHTRLPALCSNKFVDLLIGSGVDITVESFNEDEIDEIKTNQTQEILNEIYKDNNLFELLTKSIANESWGGDIAWKIVIDTNFSKLPIVQSYDIRNYEVITKYGREQAIIFKEWHEHEKSKYELHEIYSQNENGDAEIEYILYKVVVDKKEIVSLNSIPQTKKIIEMLDSDGEENKITFVGLKTPLAWHKANRLPNTEFNGSPYGESDYAGCYSLFDSADEIVSTNIDDVRKNRTLRFIPDSLIPRDEKGQIVKFNDFKLNYIQVNGNDAAGSDNENEIRTSTPPSNTLEHIENWKNMLTTILNNIGISPTTIGITGLESIIASAESQQEREKVSLRTRKTKIELWKPFLSKVSVGLLMVYEYIDNLIGISKELGLESVDGISKATTNVNVTFGDYSIKPIEERLAIYGQALQSGSISIETLVRQTWSNIMSEEEMIEEINRLKMEKGISLSNIDNMLLE